MKAVDRCANIQSDEASAWPSLRAAAHFPTATPTWQATAWAIDASSTHKAMTRGSATITSNTLPTRGLCTYKACVPNSTRLELQQFAQLLLLHLNMYNESKTPSSSQSHKYTHSAAYTHAHGNPNILQDDEGSAKQLEPQQKAAEVSRAQLVLQGVTQHLGVLFPVDLGVYDMGGTLRGS